MSNRKPKQVERYPLGRSPFSQNPTQRTVGELLGESRDDLRRLIHYKNQFVVRRQQVINGKERDLAYPVDRLRVLHERLKFHLTKIKQPKYLFSPRRGHAQRDNAAFHIRQTQFLTIDLKKFYPSTTRSMIKRCFVELFEMEDDVAGLLAHLSTVDDKASFGSPLTPILCTLVHREMFSEIADLCSARGLRFSLWVDDLTISGRYIPGELLEQIRIVIRRYGLKSHKIRFRTGKRPVFVTGIGILGEHCVAPSSLHLKIRDGWERVHAALTEEEYDDASRCQLSLLGALRHILGPRSAKGKKIADEMNSLRQKRRKRLGQRVSFSTGAAFPARPTSECKVETIARIPF